MEDTAVSSAFSVFIEYGGIGLLAAMYVFLFKWVLKEFEKQKKEYQDIIREASEREKNYQSIIGKLSDELPEMRETLARIESRISDKPPTGT